MDNTGYEPVHATVEDLKTMSESKINCFSMWILRFIREAEAQKRLEAEQHKQEAES